MYILPAEPSRMILMEDGPTKVMGLRVVNYLCQAQAQLMTGLHRSATRIAGCNRSYMLIMKILMVRTTEIITEVTEAPGNLAIRIWEVHVVLACLKATRVTASARRVHGECTASASSSLCGHSACGVTVASVASRFLGTRNRKLSTFGRSEVRKFAGSNKRRSRRLAGQSQASRSVHAMHARPPL